MKIKLLSLLLLTATSLQAKPIGDNKLTTIESELAKLINDYRQKNGKPRITISKSLTYVARWHVWDANNHNAIQGRCNLHSWSQAKPSLWDAVCYSSDHSQAQQMWKKPAQITKGVFPGNGYEIAVGGSSWKASAQEAFDLWLGSPSHRQVIIEQGNFSNIGFKSMGVGINGGYAFVWFAVETDPQGTFTKPTQPKSKVFFDSFE